MTKYNVRGSSVFLANALDQIPPLDALPIATYMVAVHPEMGYFLSRVEPFELPPKLYGNTKSIAKRVLDTFADRTGTTGVLLAGTKGSGKSLAMKQISVEAAKLSIPTIIVGAAHCGEGFNKFVASINQPALFVFDEFEKVYEKDQQNALLTLFDGIFSSKKLFLLTVNDKYSVSEYMKNRPGRIYYNIEYNGLNSAFIREYCEDRLKDQAYLDKILAFTGLFQDFNFDMLQALVEELNRYGEPIKDALAILNIKQAGRLPTYDVKYYTKAGQQIDPKLVGPSSTRTILENDTFTYNLVKPRLTVEQLAIAKAELDSPWFEDDQDPDGDDDIFLPCSVSTQGAHVSKNADLSEIIVESERHRIVFTKQIPDYSNEYYGAI